MVIEEVNTKFISTGTQTDESSFIYNCDVPIREYCSDNNSTTEDDFSHDNDFNYEENESETDEYGVESINHKYLLVEWDKLKLLMKHCLICGREAVISKLLLLVRDQLLFP